MSEEPTAPAIGERYVKFVDPGRGRTVTVNRVWKNDDGRTAVAYDWYDRGQVFSACPLDVFYRSYRSVEQRSARDELIHYIGEHGGVQPHIVDHLLNAYVHELAEKQRAQRAPAGVLAVPGWAAIWRQAVNDSADLIDSEVSDSGV